MSGLAVFFQAFLASKNELDGEDKDNNDDAYNDEADAVECLDPSEYGRSLSQCHQPADNVLTSSSTTTAASNVVITTSSRPLLHINESDGEEHEQAENDFKQTRKIDKKEILAFFEIRISTPKEPEQEECEPAEATQTHTDYHHLDRDDDDDDLEPETQQNEPLLQFPNDTTNHTTTPLSVIPHISETNGTVLNINEISLHAKFIQLNLCSVDKVWAFRSTIRNENHPARNSEYFQNDGPLGRIYEKVISVEIQQLSETPASELRHRVEQLYNVNPIHTIKVFFYNAYAERMNELLNSVRAEWKKRKLESGVQLYMALQNIPAICVVPTHNHKSDWYQSAQRYCLCIGNESILKIRDRFDIPHHVPFDHYAMRINVLLVDDDRTPIAEFRIYPLRKGGRVVLRKVDITTGASNNQQSFIQSNYRTIVVDNINNNKENVEENSASGALDNGNGTQADKAMSNGEAEAAPSVKAPSCVPEDHEEPVAGSTRTQSEQHHDVAGSRKRQRTEQNKLTYEKFDQFSLVLEMEAAVKFTSPVNESKHINTFGAVLSFTQPSLTKRGDWSMTLTLVDDTLSLYEHELGATPFYIRSISAIIFVARNEKDRLPKVRYAGDVIRLHKAKLKTWNGDLQLTCFPDRQATSVVFRGDVDDPNAAEKFTAVPSSGAATVTDNDREAALKLWKWAQERLRRYATLKIDRRFKISDMRPHDSTAMEFHGDSANGDLTAMVTAIIPVDQHSRSLTFIPPRGFLRLWDGTGPPTSDPLPSNSPIAMEAVRTGDPPAAALIKLSEIIKKIRKYHNIELLRPPKKLSGRVATIAVYEKQYWDLVDEGIVKVGSFIRLRNIKESRLEGLGLSCLIVQDKSSFTPLPNLTFEVVHLIEEHNNRLLRQDPTNPDSGILPLGAEGDMGCAGTLQNVNNHTITLERADQSLATGPMEQQRTARSRDTSEVLPRNGFKKRPRRFERLQGFISAPIGSRFEGYIRVIEIYPSQQTLSMHGLKQICCQNSSELSSEDHYYCFGLHIQDEVDDSCEIDVIVSEGSGSAGLVVFGMPAAAALADRHGALFNLRNVLQDRAVRKAAIHSFESGGCKYFSLDSMS